MKELPDSEFPASEPSSEPERFLDEESPTRPQGRRMRCPRCNGQGMDALEMDGGSYKAIRCSLCVGLKTVPRHVYDEWKVRNG